MRQSVIVKNFAVMTALMVLFIIYGSLYPFAFHHPAGGSGPVATLIASWSQRPGRGDFLANILFYIPLGYFATLAICRDISVPVRAGLALLLGTTLTIAMELTQYYDAGRDEEATDVYSNVIGTACGIVAALWFGGVRWEKLSHQRFANPAVTILLAAWALYNLYPFVPVIDLHKYWSALKPVVLYPSATAYEIFGHAAVWVAAAALMDDAVQGQRLWLWFGAFAAFLLGTKIFIADASLSVAEIAGAGCGLVWCIALRHAPRSLRTITACALLGLFVIARRLEPFHFLAEARSFGWTPFLGFMSGSIGANMESFLEKFFLYGSLVLLLQQIGLRLLAATLSVAAGLFATSWLETHLPGRSAEITDAALALFAGLTIALVRRPSPGTGLGQLPH
jgi:VanZ family protein